MPVGWINASGRASPTGAANAYASLRKVLGYTGADLVEAACVRIPVLHADVDRDGLVFDPAIRAQIAGVLTALSQHAAQRRGEE